MLLHAVTLADTAHVEKAAVTETAAVALATAPPVEGTAVGDAAAVTLADTAHVEKAAVADVAAACATAALV
jgi:hypothetical protein